MNMFFRALSSAGLALIALVGPAQAENYLPKMGGDGGSHFSDPCPDGQNLAGVEIRGGNEVDAIRPVCVLAYGPDLISPPVLTTGTGLVQVRVSDLFGGIMEEQVAPGWHGGTGGSMMPLLCPSSAPVVVGMNIVSQGLPTITVDAIELFCGRAVTTQVAPEFPSAVFEGKRYIYTNRGRELGEVRRHSQRCPAGEVAVGIHGSTGLWVDSIALICAPPRIVPNDGKGVKPAARVKGTMPSGPPPGICESAAAAQARNSPAATGLQQQCEAHTARANEEAQAQDRKIADLAIRGAVIGLKDPAIIGLRDRLGMVMRERFAVVKELQAQEVRAFDVGLAAAEGHTEWGPGKERLANSFSYRPQAAFRLAAEYTVDRNRHMERVLIGAAIVEADPELAAAKEASIDPRFGLGFDIATAIFGDPALGAQGNTALGPGSLGTRGTLSERAQAGFDAAIKMHLSRTYGE